MPHIRDIKKAKHMYETYQQVGAYEEYLRNEDARIDEMANLEAQADMATAEAKAAALNAYFNY